MFLPFTTFDDGTQMFRGTSQFYIMGGQKLKKMCVLVQYARTEKPIFSVWLNWKRFENVFMISKMSEMHCTASGVELSAQLEEKESRMVMRKVLFLPGEDQNKENRRMNVAQVRGGWSRYLGRSRCCTSGRLTRAG